MVDLADFDDFDVVSIVVVIVHDYYHYPHPFPNYFPPRVFLALTIILRIFLLDPTPSFVRLKS